MEAKGYRWLKITSILFLIIGGVQLVATIVLTHFGYQLFLSSPLLLDLDMATTTSGLTSILSLGAGVLGLHYCKNTERAKLCFMVGMFVLLINLAIGVFNILQRIQMGEGFSFASLFLLLFSLLLPLAYLVGARKNMPPSDMD